MYVFFTQMTSVPILKQRLIFQGKLMKDNEKLSFYKIANLNVIHLVANSGPPSTNINTGGDSQTNQNNLRADPLHGRNILHKDYLNA
jgi:Ubiquitin family